MTSQIILITGANKGLGFETARNLGRDDATILVGARSTELGEKAVAALRGDGVDARFVHVDVTDQASVEAAAERIEREHGRLDVLINNAGITTTGLDARPPSGIAADLVRTAFETNVFGVITVTNAMLPLLRRAPAGRIVNVSSSLGSLTLMGEPDSPRPNLLPYNTSKSALNAVTVAYARELADTPIKVRAVCPGFCATDLNGHAGLRAAAEGAAVIADIARLGEDAPAGVLLDENGLVPW